MLDSVEYRVLDPRLGNLWPLPSYSTEGAAAIDLRAMLDKTLVLAPGQLELVSVGFSIHIANPLACAVILPRSGLGHKGLVLGNGTGLIDSDYQGPLMVSALNRIDREITIEPGDRFAQLVFLPIFRPTLSLVDEFRQSKRGDGGFGHTGVA